MAEPTLEIWQPAAPEGQRVLAAPLLVGDGTEPQLPPRHRRAALVGVLRGASLTTNLWLAQLRGVHRPVLGLARVASPPWPAPIGRWSSRAPAVVGSTSGPDGGVEHRRRQPRPQRHAM